MEEGDLLKETAQMIRSNKIIYRLCKLYLQLQSLRVMCQLQSDLRA